MMLMLPPVLEASSTHNHISHLCDVLEDDLHPSTTTAWSAFVRCFFTLCHHHSAQVLRVRKGFVARQAKPGNAHKMLHYVTLGC